MDAFVDAFFAIDRDESGQITAEELQLYMKEHNYDEVFAKKWLELFDTKGTGEINLEDYCAVLGLEPKKVKEQRAAKLPADVTVISADMDADNQFSVIDVVREGMAKFQNEKDVVKYIKQELDRRLGKLWHCIIVMGQYWSYYSYEPGYSFVFKIGRHIFILFRTPGC